MQTTTITATFTGKRNNLEDASACAIHYASLRRFAGRTLTVTYICETDDDNKALQDVMDSIDIERVESLGCECVGIG